LDVLNGEISKLLVGLTAFREDETVVDEKELNNLFPLTIGVVLNSPFNYLILENACNGLPSPQIVNLH